MTDPATFPIGTKAVRRIGFGAMQLPGPDVFGPPRDHAEALRVLRRAVELGVDHIDTAQFYGPDVANDLIREALHPYSDDLVLVSKVGAKRDAQGGWLPAATPAELRAGVLDNLRSLGVEQLGAVNLRVFEPAAPDAAFEERLAALVAIRDEGLIAGVGVSNVSLAQFERATNLTSIVCVQNLFNVIDRSSASVLEACAERGVAFVPFFPMGSGFAGMNQVLDAPAVTETATRLGVTPGQVALAWVLAQGPNVLLIPGTSSVAHLEQNLAAGDVVLDDEALAALDAIAA